MHRYVLLETIMGLSGMNRKQNRFRLLQDILWTFVFSAENLFAYSLIVIIFRQQQTMCVVYIVQQLAGVIHIFACCVKLRPGGRFWPAV